MRLALLRVPYDQNTLLILIRVNRIKIINLKNGVFFKFCHTSLIQQDKIMDNCSICASNFNNPCTLPCNHRFCSVCIAKWFIRSASCPLCRCDCTEWSAKWAQGADAPLVIQIHGSASDDDDSDYDDFRTMLDALGDSFFSEPPSVVFQRLIDRDAENVTFQPAPMFDVDAGSAAHYQTQSEQIMWNDISQLLS